MSIIAIKPYLVSATLCLSVALSGVSVSVQAAPAQAALEHSVALSATRDLLQANQALQSAANPAARSQALKNLIRKAQARRQLLAELIRSNPAQALQFSIPEEKQLGMPAEVQNHLEQIVTLKGKLEVSYEDYADGSHKLRRFLKTPFGQRFELQQAGKHQDLLSGDAVEVHGVLLSDINDEDNTDGLLAADEAERGILTLEAGTSTTGGSNGGTAAPVANTFGEQKVGVFLINFQDAPGDQPFTKADVQNSVFGDTDAFIQENSFGQTWLTGDVYGWYTAPVSSSICDTSTVQSSAMAQAESTGADLSQYNRLIFITPYTNACKWSGVGSVGGNPSTSTINGSIPYSTIAHEFGHNLGLYHSHAHECGSTSTGANCSSIEYGNIPDIMGTMVAGHYNAFQKERLGWLGYGNSPAITTVNNSGSYSISPYSAQDGGIKALKVYNGMDATTGAQSYYYIEHRQPIGFDSELTIAGNYLDGVTVTSGAPGEGDSSYLLDMTPETSSWWDAALEPGFQFSDPVSGNSILTQTANSNGASIYVEATAASECTAVNAGLVVDPVFSQVITAGNTVSYTLDISNTDSSACAAATVNITATTPSGWSTSGPSSVTLLPGESTSVSLQVNSASSASADYHLVSIGVDKAGLETSVSRYIYTESGSSTSNNPPVANNDSTSTPQDTAVTLNVLANDTDADGDSLSVTSTSGVNGSAVINPNGSITFTPISGFSGIEVFSYTISDGQGGSDSATVSVNVIAASINTAPVAQSDSATINAGSSATINVLANDTNADGDNLTVTGTAGVNGTAVINANGSITFTPANGFSGTETFTYSVSDGNGGTASAAVNVIINALNSAPQAYNDSASTSEATAVTLNVLANDTDADGDSLTVTGTSGVNGSAAINANGSITFTPVSGFSGTETFNYSVSDGNGGTASATVTVTVSSSNSAPVAISDTAITTGSAVTIAVLSNDSDADGDSLSIISVAEGGKGSVNINADGTLTFTPARNFKSTDSFSYTVTDGQLTASANVTVNLQSSDSDTGGSGGKGNGRKK